MRGQFFLSLSAVHVFALTVGCSEPECSNDEKKVGTVCVALSKPGTKESQDGGQEGREPSGQVQSGTPSSETLDAALEPSPQSQEQAPDAGGGKTEVPDPNLAADAATPDAPTCVPAAESCDGMDNDCNGLIDDNAQGQVTWFSDCDGDGYAASTAGSVSSCSAPAPMQGCKAWTQVAPSGVGYTDCDPNNADYRPGAPYGVPTGTNPSHDLNCNGTPELETSFTTDAGDKLPVCQRYDCNCYVPWMSVGASFSEADLQPWGAWFGADLLNAVAPTMPCGVSDEQIPFAKLVPAPPGGARRCTVGEKDATGKAIFVLGRRLCR